MPQGREGQKGWYRVRPCLGANDKPCPTRAITATTRCPSCTRAKDRQRTSTRVGYGGEYQANRAKVLSGEARCYVLTCSAAATTADHIVPLRDGGSHDLANLRPSCVKHNSGRR